VKDEVEAAHYYKIAADQNDADAQFHCALCLEDGQCVVQNDSGASGYFKLAPDQNDASSQKRSAICLATAIVRKEGTAQATKTVPADKTKRPHRHRTKAPDGSENATVVGDQSKGGNRGGHETCPSRQNKGTDGCSLCDAFISDRNPNAKWHFPAKIPLYHMTRREFIVESACTGRQSYRGAHSHG
jgi:hypothetical protein